MKISHLLIGLPVIALIALIAFLALSETPVSTTQIKKTIPNEQFFNKQNAAP